jgi:C1A family cysteine protease
MPRLQLSPAGHRYGLIPRVAPALTPITPARTTGFPVRASLTGIVGPTKNQGSQGSCDGHASSSMGERLYLRWTKKYLQFSPAYSYYRERAIEGTLSQGDCGAQITSAVQVPDPRTPSGSGWCPLMFMAYNENDCSTPPSQYAQSAAMAHPGGAFHSLGNNLANIKSAILSDYSFIIGISVYDSFESDATAASGLIPYPDINSENLLGGHALHTGMAYDDTIQCPNAAGPGAVMFQNSWGTAWGAKCPLTGEGGFAWIPYSYLLNPNLCQDVRLGHLGRAWA